MNNTIFKSVLEILPVARLVNGESNYDYAGIVIIFGTWISLSSTDVLYIRFERFVYDITFARSDEIARGKRCHSEQKIIGVSNCQRVSAFIPGESNISEYIYARIELLLPRVCVCIFYRVFLASSPVASDAPSKTCG